MILYAHLRSFYAILTGSAHTFARQLPVAFGPHKLNPNRLPAVPFLNSGMHNHVGNVAQYLLDPRFMAGKVDKESGS